MGYPQVQVKVLAMTVNTFGADLGPKGSAILINSVPFLFQEGLSGSSAKSYLAALCYMQIAMVWGTLRWQNWAM